VNSVKIDSEKPLRAYLSGGSDPVPLGTVRRIEVRRTGKGFFINEKPYFQESVRIVTDHPPLRVDGREVRGVVEVFRTPQGTLLVVNEVELEAYLKGVVPNEMPDKWPLEALKAQAVASRSYALHMRAKRIGQPYFLESGYLDQVYKGIECETPGTNRAVTETEGIVMTYKDEIAQTLFHSTAGGRTESFADVFYQDRPYLTSVVCPYDKDSPHSSWQVKVPVEEIRKRLNLGGYQVGEIIQFSIHSVSPTGRIKLIFIEHRRNTKIYSLRISGQDFRRAMGFNFLKSTRFQIGLHGGSILFRGHGFGHGVGMCQWGAKGMADQGKTFQEILRFYYPSAELAKNHARPDGDRVSTLDTVE
jgi:stage II sporulation protein D